MALNLPSPGSEELDIKVTKDKEYKYPYENNFKPDSPLHKKVLDRILRMVDDSSSVMEKRYDTWNKTDETLRAYIKLSDYEKQIKTKDERRPVSVVVPYSYATMETIMAYLTKIHLEPEVFSFEGVGPEDTIGAKLLELVVIQQVNRFKSQLEMHTALRDSLAYGIGASTVNWREVWGKKPRIETQNQFSLLGATMSPIRRKVTEDALLFEGNEVITIDPYRMLPDPNVSIHNVQGGEFIGWVEFKSVLSLENDEAAGDYFNIAYLQDRKSNERESKFSIDKSSRIMSREERRTPNTTSYVSIVNMYVTLVPKNWGLACDTAGDMPEIWLFTIADEEVIIRATPLNLNHNMYPVATASPDFDGYSITPLARMELIGGLQTVLNWMFNSHVANVRKAINDMFIVDPSMINMQDLKDPEPGKLIRMRRSAWGRGVENAIKQFQVTDITKGNMQDAYSIMELMQKASAASDTTMGALRNKGERVTASEFSGTMQMAVSRLDHISRIISMQYIQDLAYMHASHTQQLMSESTYVRAIGEWPEVLEQEYMRNNKTKRLRVSPFDIIADFDIIFRDNSTNTADALSNDFWIRTFQTLATSEGLGGAFDLVRIFKHMARINGAKNVGDFIQKGGDVNVSTAPDKDIIREAERGNAVSIEELTSMYGQNDQSDRFEPRGMEGF